MERLDKILAHLGFGTRTEVKKMVRAGRVLVDGEPARNPGQMIDPVQAELVVDGAVHRYRSQVHLMLHKPAGVITATSDRSDETVLDLVGPEHYQKGLHPVGRLDRDTEGLLLLTTDGELSHRLTSPRRHVEKEYYALLDGPVGPDAVRAFAAGGLEIGEGVQALPARLALEPEPGTHPVTGEPHPAARVTVVEGKFHQVKRMFAAVGREVRYLKRLRMGSLHLDPDLGPGELRPLTEAEVAALYAACGMAQP